MANFVDVKNMQEVRSILTQNELKSFTNVLNRLSTERGCSKYLIQIKADEKWLDEIWYGVALIYGVNTDSKIEFHVKLRFKNNESNIDTPEIDGIKWMSNDRINDRYQFVYSAIKEPMIPRRSGRIQLWNRVR